MPKKGCQEEPLTRKTVQLLSVNQQPAHSEGQAALRREQADF